jgi:hypothetical protein
MRERRCEYRFGWRACFAHEISVEAKIISENLEVLLILLPRKDRVDLRGKFVRRQPRATKYALSKKLRR